MPIKVINSSGSIRRWVFTEDIDVPGSPGETIDIESSSVEDGDVLLCMGRGQHAAWVRKSEIEEFIETLREASKMPCDSCDGKGYK